MYFLLLWNPKKSCLTIRGLSFGCCGLCHLWFVGSLLILVSLREDKQTPSICMYRSVAHLLHSHTALLRARHMATLSLLGGCFQPWHSSGEGSTVFGRQPTILATLMCVFWTLGQVQFSAWGPSCLCPSVYVCVSVRPVLGSLFFPKLKIYSSPSSFLSGYKLLLFLLHWSISSLWIYRTFTLCFWFVPFWVFIYFKNKSI